MEHIIIGKHMLDITLNPLEYLMDDKGEYLTFDTEEDAKQFLRDRDISEEAIEGLYFKRYDKEQDIILTGGLI